MNLADMFPLIVPRNYYVKGTWELPHYQLANEDFILTWVLISSGNSMSYITKQAFDDLNTNHQGWQKQTFENLRHSIADNENFFTHHNQRQNLKGIKFLGFLHGDGMGSSRILLKHELTNAFPEGYYVAFPDRSCGLIIPKSLNGDELKEVKRLVKDMYENSTTPMSGELHEAERFLLPDDWLMPIDERYSKGLINEITKLIQDR